MEIGKLSAVFYPSLKINDPDLLEEQEMGLVFLIILTYQPLFFAKKFILLHQFFQKHLISCTYCLLIIIPNYQKFLKKWM